MINNIKLGLKLVKYGFRPKTNLIICLFFLVIGALDEISSKGRTFLGGACLMLVSMFVFQMIISMDIAAFIQGSSYKKALQTSVPATTSVFINFITYTIVVEKIYLITRYPEDEQIILEGFLFIIFFLFGMMIYAGFSFKIFVVATIGYSMYTIFTVSVIEIFQETSLSFEILVVLGYLAIIVGGILEYLISCALYKKKLSEFAFKGILGKLK